MSSIESCFGCVVGPVERSWAARPQRLETTSSSSSSVVWWLDRDFEDETNPARLREAVVSDRQRPPPRFPSLARKHKAERAELRRRYRHEADLLVEQLQRRYQEEKNEQRARHAGEFLAKRAQFTRDPRERPINRDPETCTICLDDLCDDELAIRTLDCRHKYHKICINKWLTNKTLCPLCKRRAF